MQVFKPRTWIVPKHFLSNQNLLNFTKKNVKPYDNHAIFTDVVISENYNTINTSENLKISWFALVIVSLN